jgi:serpin B
VESVDFRGAAEAARATINTWVEDRTHQRIRDLIPPGGVDGETRLVLVNAVYFKGKWVLQFDKTDTVDAPFYLARRKTVQAPLMHQQGQLRYLGGDGYQAVDLDYEGGELSLLVLLPDDRDGLPALEARLSPAMLRSCVAGLADREVDLFLPRFKLTWGTVNVADYLQTLGLQLPFVRLQADFSGINGYEPPHEESLYITAVLHKAFVDVNEEGTEAAAATAVTMDLCGCVPSDTQVIPVFRADHPFLLAIRDKSSGVLLFLGRVVDPTLE